MRSKVPNLYVPPALSDLDSQANRVIRDLAERVNYLTTEIERMKAGMPEAGAKKEKPQPGVVTIPGLGQDGFIRVNEDGVIASYTNPIDFFGDMGTFFNDVTVYSTGANTTETTFTSRELPANFLANDGDYLIYLMRSLDANNANNKRYRIKFDSTVMFDTTALAFQGAHMFIGFWHRETSSVLVSIGIHSTFFGGAFVTAPQLNALTGVNFSTSHTFSVTCQNGTATAGDIVLAGVIVIKGNVPTR